ncbi:MAG: hypothetical protein HKP61_16240 [Dactylosporangium sp.]|nr:hypothetical protein [Dactylosporangium sp.]
MTREAFLDFRAAPLPLAAHTADQARATVRRRRQMRAVVAGVAALLAVGVPVAANVLTGDRSNGPSPVGQSSEAPAPSATGSPNDAGSLSSDGSSTSASTQLSADLVVSPTMMLTKGSAGKVLAEVAVSVLNRGPATVDKVDLTFAPGSGIIPLGPLWGGCSRDDAHKTVTCSRTAPPVGASRQYVFQFGILAWDNVNKTVVTVRPHGASDPRKADNTAKVTTCTNGCGGQNNPTTDLSISVSKLLTNGSVGKVTGTAQVTLHNQGPAAPAVVALEFIFGNGIEPQGNGWNDCVRDDTAIRCVMRAPTVGGSRTYPVTFSVDLTGPSRDLTIYSSPMDRVVDPNSSNSSAKTEVCTNGG